MTRSKLVIAVLLLTWSGLAMAAKNATVQGKNVVLRGEPDTNSDILAHLEDGEPVQISNYPTQGYYKIRTESGQVGWVASTAVGEEEALPPPATNPAPVAAASSPPVAPPAALPAVAASPAPVKPALSYEDVQASQPYRAEGQEGEEAPKWPHYPFELKVFGGYQKISPTQINDLFGGSVFSGLPYFGAQFGVPLTDRLFALFRIERLTASTNTNGWNLSLSSLPMMAGFEYALIHGHGCQLQLSALMGVGFSTTLDATAVTYAPPNLTEFSSNAFTQLFKADFDIPFSKKFYIYVEGGYRLLKTDSLGPAPLGAGGGIFVTGSGQNATATLDLSGPFFGGGFSFLL